jgi:pimeloyl-ACP methyl ester carboxylesterase
MPQPGMLLVTMQPRPGLSLDQFHEWYNNEHGPTRLRIPSIFANGLRFAAADGAEPTFVALYDVTDMQLLTTETYTSLRANRSPREAATIGQVDVKRHFLDLVAQESAPGFVPVEGLPDELAAGTVLALVEIGLNDKEGAEEEYNKWLEEEHVPMLSKVPGWLRSRRFKSSTLESGGVAKFYNLHEYAKENGLGGPEHKAAMSTPRREALFDKHVTSKGRRAYQFLYAFGPGPRDLQHLSRLPGSAAFADQTTATTPGPSAVITSHITAEDSLIIPYRLEGNPSPAAPTIAFANSLLTSLHMWDALVAALLAARPEFRVLRYDARGRHAIPSPPVPATLETLADDLAALLGALRIPRLHALVGVSMGGATTLRFALRHPDRLGRFVACDFNVASSAANTAAWKERIGVAESTLADGRSGIHELAGATVERWFHPHTMTQKRDVAEGMVRMVGENDVEGFRYSCQALWDYDMKEEMKGCRVPGLLVVGDGDGKGALVRAMEGFKGLVGGEGAELKIVPNAGHLPMTESPEEFWEAIKGFL